ncbi:GTPase [Azospirillum endophyticum]
MDSRTPGSPRHDVLSVLPNRAHDLARLQELAAGDEPIVTVIGKYNHGKSRLLNELVGRDVFAVADRRETTTLSVWLHRGVRWLDAPGLDADVGTEDDRHALQAAWLKSDIRLFVHTAKEGELDAKELALLDELRKDALRTRRQTLFVLTQIDQLVDEGELGKVQAAIHKQVTDTTVHTVSATRHRQGVERAKKLLVDRSGIPSLQALLEDALGRVPDARAHEARLLFGEIRDELDELHARQARTLEALCRNQVQQRQAFDEGLDTVLDKVGRDIEQVIDAPVPDYAMAADTAQDKYRMTQAKLERARIQIAYSRACIQIDSFLVGHGVVGLPKEQQVAAGSLNSVMVAVMGVSVKFRKDLRSQFCEASGQARLHREFAHYYERSKDREASRAEITAAESAVAATQQALAALSAMEPDT